MPTNYLLPLLAQPGQMQLIYTVSPGVSHTTGTLHAGPRELYSPELGLFGGGDEEAQVVPQLFITQDFFIFSPLVNPGSCKTLPAKLQLASANLAVNPFFINPRHVLEWEGRISSQKCP